MNYFIGIIVTIVLLLFAFVLQKWRTSIKAGITSLDGKRKLQHKNTVGFLIDVFTIGTVGIALTLIYLMFVK
jgi:hypothetical protein